MATQNLEQVRNLLDKMADLRTRAPSEINIITMEWIQTTLKCLKTVKIHLQTQQKSFDINNELLDKFSDIGHTYDDTTLDLLPVYEQTQLLNILTKMKNSPVCRIVNEI